jgi:MoaA/NifB/PqqE/SkfB family radical SAM enzyme
MLSLDKITFLHTELTTRCNAHCPGCRRNNAGFGLAADLELMDLSVERFKEVVDMLPNLTTVQLCGNKGDPISSPHFYDIVDFCLEKKFKIHIHTNGGVKTTSWWHKLGKKLNSLNHSVTFGIDGLADTHGLYRQGVSFDKVIDNAKAFIDAGGPAAWQFIMFKHNAHQIEEAQALSRQLKFLRFFTVVSWRMRTARHYKTGEEYLLEQHFEDTGKPVPARRQGIYAETEVKYCMHLDFRSIYLNARGNISTCCYMDDVPYEGNDIDQQIRNQQPNDICKKACGTLKL